MSKQVTITIDTNSKPEEIFNLLQQLGVYNAILDKNEIKATVAENLVNPLRSVAGVANVEIVAEKIDNPAPVPQAGIPTKDAPTLPVAPHGFPTGVAGPSVPSQFRDSPKKSRYSK